MVQKKIKILFFNGSLIGGGAERVSVQILNHLDRLKYTLCLALFKKEGPYLSSLNKDVAVYELSGCRTGFKKIFYSRKPIRNLIRAIKPDLIVAHVMTTNIIVMLAVITLKNRPPIIICEHNNTYLTLQNVNSFFRATFLKFCVRICYRWASKIIAVSEGIKQSLVNNFGIDKDNIAVIHNPIDIKEIIDSLHMIKFYKMQKDKSKKHIVAMGRLTKQKAFSDLITAFGNVLNDIPARLTILGEGELRPELEKQISEANLEDHVDLPGFINNPWHIIKSADLFILSSHWEGFGNVIVEAMACGTAVIATDCNYGPSEIIEEGKEGLLVPVGDVVSMQKAIIYLLKDDLRREQIVKAAKIKAQKFETVTVTKKYQTVFDQLIQ